MSDQPVEKWGYEAIVTDEFMANAAVDVRAYLIEACARGAEKEGRAHLPGGETVEFLSQKDVPFNELPPRSKLARVTVRCVKR